MGKKGFSFFLAVAMLLSLFPQFALPAAAAGTWDGTSIASGFAGGNGTEKEPFLISDGTQLAYLAKQVNNKTDYAGKYFKLTEDIDLGGKEWTPIGGLFIISGPEGMAVSEVAFKGYFDGNDKTVSNLSITELGKDEVSVGLFGCISGGQVKNLTVGGSINLTKTTPGIRRDELDVGLLCGSATKPCSLPTEFSFLNCRTAGTISMANAEVNNLAMQKRFGGIVGYVYGKNKALLACESKVNISINADSTSNRSYFYVGGIAGYIFGDATNYHISTIDVGFSNCINKGNISVSAISQEKNVGGICGRIGYKAVLVGCVNTGSISTSGGGTENVGGMTGAAYKDSSIFDGCIWLDTTLKIMGGANVPDSIPGSSVKTSDQMKDQALLTTLNNGVKGYWGSCLWVAGEDGYPALGTEKNTEIIEISTESDLIAMRDKINSGAYTYGGKLVKLKKDIAVTSWTQIQKPFCGTFDGGGHTITCTSIEKGEVVDSVGFFSGIQNAIVKNLTINGTINIPSSSEIQNVGLLVAQGGNSQIMNCTTKGSIFVASDITSVPTWLLQVGGLMGYSSEHSDLNNCRNEASVEVTTNTNGAIVGGVFGYSLTRNSPNTPLLNLSNVGDIKVKTSPEKNLFAGGIGGGVQGFGPKLVNCYNTGSITADPASTNGFCGGIVGKTTFNYNAQYCTENVLKSCYSTGTISGANRGGIVGLDDTSAKEVSIKNCYWLSSTATDALGKNNNSQAVWTDCIAQSEEELKKADMLEFLNGAAIDSGFADLFYWSKDSKNTNNGYPILSKEPIKPVTAKAKYGGEGGEELFLHGEFLELGISKWGDFGTLGQKPAGFRGTNGSTRIGMSADHDGFNNGLDMPVDYYLPGCPEERFVVGYKDAEQKAHTNTNSAVMGDKNMNTTVTNLSKTADGLLKAKVVSTWDGVMEVTQIIQFQDNEQFFRNEVTIKNLSANPLDSVRYMRTFDPDNTVFMGGSYVTKNTILDNSANGADGKAVVVAETADENDPLKKSSLNTTAPIFFYSKDPRAKVSSFGFTNKDPYYPLAYDNARTKDYTITTDGAISMAMDTGKIEKDASSETFIYYTSLDKRVFSEVIKDIQGDEGGTPVTPPNENPPSYQVTFQDENGTEITKATVVKGTSATKPEPPSLSGKVFSEWQVTVGSPSTLDAVNNDMTVKAVYKTATTYVVTFNSDGDSPVDSLNVTANSLITEPAVPTKAGYTFKGWKKDANDYWAFASDKVSSNISLTADWAANPSVFFQSAEAIPDVTVDIGTPKEAALAKLPTSVEITDSASQKHTVTVKWAFNTVGGVYDPYQPGRYVGIGEFTLPDGVAWENDQPIKLQGIVYIADLAKRVSSIAIKDKTTTTIAYPYDLEHPLTLAAEVLPADANIKTYRWSSSDVSVATIDQAGKITPLKGGTTTITVTSDDGGKTDSLAITVAKSNECDVLIWKAPASPTIATDNAQKVSKTVENATDKLKVDVTVSPKASWKLYSESACANEIANQDWALSYGDNTAYLKVTAEDGVATKTYALTVTRPKLVVDATDLTSLITAPIKLDSPVTTAINATQYSSGSIVWKTKEGDAQTTPFEGKKEYVASVTLTPKEGYTFDGFTSNFSYIGATKVETSGSGDSRTVTITFPATDEKIRPHIAVAPTVASNELTYGEALSKLTWNNTPSAQKSMTSSVAVDGDFAWVDSSIKPDVPVTGTYSAEWVFTPTDTDNYVVTKGTVAITVHPKELTIKGIIIEDKFYDGVTTATIGGTAALDGVLTVDASNVTLTKTNATASFSDANVGGDKAVTVSGYALSGSRAGNYALKQPEGLKANIKEDKTAPILTADAVSRVSHTNASISFRADERGTYYYVIVASGETEPSVDTSGVGTQMQGGLNTISLTNLTSGAKKIYIKGKNATGLISTLLVMDIPNYSTGGGGGGTSSLPPVVTPNVKIPVIIDGISHNLGQATTEINSQNKVKTTVVTVEEKAFNEQLEKAKESVIIPIPQLEGATANRSVLTAEMVDRAAEKKMVIDVQSKGIDYVIPATAVDVATVASSLGFSKGDFDDIQMDITITNLTEDAARFVSDAAQKGAYKLMLPPVEFKVAAAHGGRTVEVSSFNNYVERVIAIPAGIDPHRITTGVVVRPDGTEYHVPTEVFKAKDGGYYARVHSRTNSVYALIWNEESFLDSVGTWYESVVAEMASRKIIKGRDEQHFDGNGNITRAEFAAIIVRGLGLPENGKSQFNDVSANSWYYGAVGKAFEYGIIQGRSSEVFDPGANISREEVMAMLQRASVIAEFKGQEGNREVLRKQFQDYETISAWAEKDVLFNVSNGLMKGYDGKLRPNDPISRAECATAVLRLLQNAELVDVRSKT